MPGVKAVRELLAATLEGEEFVTSSIPADDPSSSMSSASAASSSEVSTRSMSTTGDGDVVNTLATCPDPSPPPTAVADADAPEFICVVVGGEFEDGLEVEADDVGVAFDVVVDDNAWVNIDGALLYFFTSTETPGRRSAGRFLSLAIGMWSTESDEQPDVAAEVALGAIGT
jgi:hypothetical protein